MTRYIYFFAALALFVACEQKQTTVNPPAEKKVIVLDKPVGHGNQERENRNQY
jgi:hypothetical protein